MNSYLLGIDVIRRENTKRLMESAGLTRGEFAEKSGISYTLLGHYIGKNPTKKIGDEIAQKIEDFFEKPRNWLDHNHEEIAFTDNVVVGDVETDIQIPIYESYFCCGDGNDTDFEEIKGYRGFSSEFFAKRNLKPQDFKLVCATNDSMSPHIEHGDEVGINIADRDIKDGEVYAILLDGAKMFKQVFVMGGGVIKLHCFNDKYEDKILTPETLSSLVIVGRKVYRAG